MPVCCRRRTLSSLVVPSVTRWESLILAVANCLDGGWAESIARGSIRSQVKWKEQSLV